MASRSIGRLELRVLVDEDLQLVGDPRQGDLLVTPALVELLDAAIGEVHEPGLSSPDPGPRSAAAKAASSSAFCSSVCRLIVPTEGEAEAGRVTGSTVTSRLGHTLSW